MSGYDALQALVAARSAGRPVVLGTTIEVEGSAPSERGNRALFAADGSLLAGTIGCTGLDRRAGADGRALLAAGERTATREYTSWEDTPGEGRVVVFLEAFPNARRLLVGGGGPVADALVALGRAVGLAAEQAALGSEDFARRAAGLGAGDAVVFVDHDDPALLDALTAVLGRDVGYVGVMGSRRHTPGFLSPLRERGVDLGPLRSPTGLDLGARTPAEIALSILAEVLAVQRGRGGGSLDIVHRKGPE